jgi:hypothetical protein
VKVTAGGTTDIGHVVLERGATINRIVVDARGVPIASADFRARKRMNNYVSAPSAVSDASGRFTLHHIPEGSILIDARLRVMRSPSPPP